MIISIIIIIIIIIYHYATGAERTNESTVGNQYLRPVFNNSIWRNGPSPWDL